MGMAMLVSVGLLRKVAEIVVGNGRPLNQWLITLVLGAPARRSRRDRRPTALR